MYVHQLTWSFHTFTPQYEDHYNRRYNSKTDQTWVRKDRELELRDDKEQRRPTREQDFRQGVNTSNKNNRDYSPKEKGEGSSNTKTHTLVTRRIVAPSPQHPRPALERLTQQQEPIDIVLNFGLKFSQT
ncbi:unnamed protein product [Cochlearia groenlandica]